MIIILSQKIDTESDYSDNVYKTYHYPLRYRNQIHEGDIFIYYQGNRYVKEQRYYFGMGKIGKITTTDNENYFAELLNTRRFSKKVPIWMTDGRYIEELGYDTVRNNKRPPWQSSIRKLSKQAYDYILQNAGELSIPDNILSLEELKTQLMMEVRKFFREKEDQAIIRIVDIGNEIIKLLNIKEIETCTAAEVNLFHDETIDIKKDVNEFEEYCKTTPMVYSYKMLLILAFLKHANYKGKMSINKAIMFFRNYYDNRRKNNKPAEIKKCIYLNPDVTDGQIKSNIISNPVKAITNSKFFRYDPIEDVITMDHETWYSINAYSKNSIRNICRERLKNYYNQVEKDNG